MDKGEFFNEVSNEIPFVFPVFLYILFLHDLFNRPCNKFHNYQF